MSYDIASTKILRRFAALLAALHNGPLCRADLFARLDGAYPATSSRRVMVDRDVKLLRELGIVIDISHTRPPVYRLRGGTPHFSTGDLHALALIHDSFGAKHPQFVAINQLLDTLTTRLDDDQRAEYARRPASRAPLQPAIDYTPHATTIVRLEQAISGREIIRFAYMNAQGVTGEHQTEPYEIEYYERHFYVVAYSLDTAQMFDYRIDRVRDIRTVRTLPPHLSRTHERPAITFRYRLAAALARGPISQRFENQRIIERLPNGDAIIEAEGRSDFFIIQLLLRYRSMAELLEPDWLREKMAAEVRGLGRMYELKEE